ncbi:hypothetical protein [Streptomyces sp. B22F1]|uniref:hypothetical protein n=1 Tax=Streptomyces sp. B22F1 TaxID=3153566 RepID=UPI00325D2C5E
MIPVLVASREKILDRDMCANATSFDLDDPAPHGLQLLQDPGHSSGLATTAPHATSAPCIRLCAA